jgi:hypothetical protein
MIEPPTPFSLPTATTKAIPVATMMDTEETGDLPDYYGGLVITMDYVGQTITMRPGQGFVLRLGKDFHWVVSITPADLLTINKKITPELDEQGVYIARKQGLAVLSAIGEPICLRSNPPCTRPKVLFQLKLDIR